MPDRPAFRPGKNIAMKMPPGDYDRLVAFYRDVLGFEVIGSAPDSVVFRYGEKRLWVDRVATLSQGEVWLEVQAEDVVAAAAWLAANGVARRDEIEELPDGFVGFWIAAPGGMIHMVTGG
jgi:catechol 2,3-dioxygenase-like lactoylglutathione lyase family enzyme